MSSLIIGRFQAHRKRTFNLPPARRITTPNQALKFVDERGFIYFWPIKGIDLPSLWTAVAGDRPVADEHDDPGHITWRWKDDALGKKRWYYAKILRRKATLISLEAVPYFYALSENFGSPEEDYLLAYEEGRLTQAAKQVYEALLNEGALNTIDLRRAAKLGNARDSEFNRALESLQADFKILPVGIAEAGAWHYSFVYEIVPRYFPEIPAKARMIGEADAREKLLELYLNSVGAVQKGDIKKLFAWETMLLSKPINQLMQTGLILETAYPGKQGEWIALPELCS